MFVPHWILLNVEIFGSWNLGFLEATGGVSPDRTLTSLFKGDLDRFVHFLDREKSWQKNNVEGSNTQLDGGFIQMFGLVFYRNDTSSQAYVLLIQWGGDPTWVIW